MKRRSKGRTWAEAAKMVLEKHPKTPMSHKEILRVIQQENLKDLSGTTPLLCLNSCLHANSRGIDCVFYKVAGRSGVYGLMSDLPEGSILCEIDEDSDSLTELVDDNGKPVLPGQNSSRSFSDKRRDKVMHVKLPKGHPFNTQHEDTALSSIINGQSEETSSTAGDISETLSEAPSTDTPASSTPSIDVGKEDLTLSNHPIAAATATSTTLITAANRLAAAKRKSRNNPLRHYTKRRKKKKNKFSRIKVRTSNTSLKSLTSNKVSSPVLSSGVDSSGTPSPTVNPLTGITQKKRQTLREMLAGLPGFSMKPRNRKNQKLSVAAQIRQTKEGCVDLENPTSILVNTNLKSLINQHTFNLLPPAYQYKVIQLLPACDQITGPENSLRMDPTSLTNEFFSKACSEWRDRLADGEFTQETQIRIKMEEEKQHSKLDPWKVKHFEPVWGKRSLRSPVAIPKSPPFSPSSPTETASIAPSTSIKSTILDHHARSVFKTVQQSPSTKAKTVSTLLKQRAISQHVRTGGTSATDKAREVKIGVSRNTNLSGMTPQEILDTVLNKNKHEEVSSPPINSSNKAGFSAISTNKVVNKVKDETVQRPAITHELLLQQLKRPSELKVETTVPCKKLKSAVSPTLYDKVAKSTTVMVTKNNTVSVSKPVTVGKLLQGAGSTSPKKSVFIQNVSVTNSQPALSSSMAAYARAHQTSTVPPLSTTNPIVQQVVANAHAAERKYQAALASCSSKSSSSTGIVETKTSNNGASKPLAQVKSPQSQTHQVLSPQQPQPRTRTLADIKAQTKAKAQQRHLPPILQQSKRPCTASSPQKNSPGRTKNSTATTAEGKVDIERSKAIVQQAIEQSHRQQQIVNMIPKQVATPETVTVRTAGSAAQSLQNLVISKQQQQAVLIAQQQQQQSTSASSGGLLMVQQQQLPSRTQVVHSVPQPIHTVVHQQQQQQTPLVQTTTKVINTASAHGGPITVADKLKAIRAQSQPPTVASLLESSQQQKTSQQQINVSHQVSVQSQPQASTSFSHVQQHVVVPGTAAASNIAAPPTTVILPSQQNLAGANNTTVYMVDPKNSEAAGGQENQSILSSVHQPERKADSVKQPGQIITNTNITSHITSRTPSTTNITVISRSVTPVNSSKTVSGPGITSVSLSHVTPVNMTVAGRSVTPICTGKPISSISTSKTVTSVVNVGQVGSSRSVTPLGNTKSLQIKAICSATSSFTQSQPNTPTAGALPKIKLIRVKSADGDSRYVLSTTSGLGGSSNNNNSGNSSQAGYNSTASHNHDKWSFSDSASDDSSPVSKVNPPAVTTPGTTVASRIISPPPIIVEKLPQNHDDTTDIQIPSPMTIPGQQNRVRIASPTPAALVSQQQTMPPSSQILTYGQQVSVKSEMSSQMDTVTIGDGSKTLTKCAFSSSHPSLQRLLSGENVTSQVSSTTNTGSSLNTHPQIFNGGNSKILGARTTVGSSEAMSQATQVSQSGINASSALLQALRSSNGIHNIRASQQQQLLQGVTTITSQSQQQKITSNLYGVTGQVGKLKMKLHGQNQTPQENGMSSNCVCNMKAMVMCKSCGAYCHNDCIGPSKLCVSCLVAAT